MTGFETQEIQNEAPYCRRQSTKKQIIPETKKKSPNCFRNEILNKIALGQITKDSSQINQSLLSNEKKQISSNSKLTPHKSFMKLNLPIQVIKSSASQRPSKNKFISSQNNNIKTSLVDNCFINSNKIKKTITQSINITSSSILPSPSHIQQKKVLIFKGRKLRSRGSLEKFPPLNVIKSLSYRHSLKVCESKVIGKDQLSISARMDKMGLDEKVENLILSKSFLCMKPKKNLIELSNEQKITNKQSPLQSVSPKPVPQCKSSENKEIIMSSNFQIFKSSTSYRKSVPSIKNSISPVRSQDKQAKVEEVIKPSQEVEIKVSLLNLDQNNKENISSKEKITSKNVSFKEKIFEEVKVNEDTQPSFANEDAPHVSEHLLQEIEDFLLEEIVRNDLYNLSGNIKQQEKKRIPKIDIQSLDEKDIERLKQFKPNLPKEKSPKLKLSENHKENNLLQMMKENNNETNLLESHKTKSPPNEIEQEEIVYAIRTNLDTIIEYSDLLLKIIQEEFFEMVKSNINFMINHKPLVNQLFLSEQIKGSYKYKDLIKLNLSQSQIKCIQANLKHSSSTAHEEEHDGYMTNNSNSYNYIPSQSTRNKDLLTDTITNVEIFESYFDESKQHNSSPSKLTPIPPPQPHTNLEEYKKENIWEYPVKPFLILPKEIFLKLTDKILSTYKEANIRQNLFNIQKIFHRSIFDSFNESLSEYIFRLKHFYLNEEEYSILKKKEFSNDEVSFCLIKAKLLLIEKASELVGFMVNKEDSTIGNVYNS
jgi:hypothetical protein